MPFLNILDYFGMLRDEYYRINTLGYYQSIVTQIINAVEHNRNVCLSSFYGCGDKRVADYVAYLLSNNRDYTIFNEYPKSYEMHTLSELRTASEKKKTLFVSQFYEYKSEMFKKELQRIVFESGGQILSILSLSSQFLKEPWKYFDSTLMYETTIVTTPIPRNMREQFLTVRQQLDHGLLTNKQKLRIAQLSGGHPGLLKYLSRIAYQKLPLDYEFVVSEPTVRNILIKLKDELEHLPPEILKRVGLLTKRGEISIPLLDTFISEKLVSLEQKLTMPQQELLNYMLQNPSSVLSLDQIHKILNPHSDFSLWATYKQIKKFASAIQSQYSIRNIKGKGYTLRPKTI